LEHARRFAIRTSKPVLPHFQPALGPILMMTLTIIIYPSDTGRRAIRLSIALNRACPSAKSNQQ
jgi:hypothetical protein